MIPTKLILHNFLCYRDAVTLDLRDVRVACISGENGAGKSSLLDAITWALWGKARTATERDLMSLGATEMGVDFHFLLGHQEYRVLRRRRRRGKSPDQAQIEVQIRDVTPDGDSPWRPISGDTLAQTQRLLSAAIGMEYDTFINSAFILQGRADEFTTKGPADRKQVLADILGLGRYDGLEERARALRRGREDERREVERELERIEAELQGRPGAEEELAAVAARLVTTTGEVARLVEELDALKAHRAELEARARGAAEAEERRDEHGREADRLRTRIAATGARIAALEAIIAEADAIRAEHAALVAAETRDGELNVALSLLNDLAARHRAAERECDTARSLRQQELHGLDHELTGLRERQGRLAALEQEYAALRERLARLDGERKRRVIVEEAITSATEEIGRRRADNDHLLREMRGLKERQEQIDAADAACPICRRSLGADEQRRIHDEYQTEGKFLADQHRGNRGRIKDLEREIAEYTSQLREIDEALRGGRALDKQLGQVGQQLDDARGAGELLTVKAAERERLAGIVERGDFAREAQAALAQLDAAIAALAYDSGEHQRVRDQVIALKPSAARMRELESAEEALRPLRERLGEDRGTLLLREGARDAEAVRAAELRAGLDGLPALIRRTEDLTFAFDRRSRERDELTQRQGALVEALRRLAEREDEGRRLREERKRLAEEEGAYRDLVRAFGKGGIQAMIIEAAVPELQDEANAILANMPGNGMRVEFRTQRETQKGDTVEALDIVIGDEAGQRNYQMYSGGESFRINFAIRVALAKLLARRAGARLQTLVIDEGFGSQDARGRDSLVEAIRAIEADFATILVITHINELKEAFPTQIVVEKTPGGSQITVN